MMKISHTLLDSDQRLRLWAAESGRCQSCGRAMDRSLADAWPTPAPFDGPEDLAAFRLVCPLCVRGVSLAWPTIRIESRILRELETFLAEPPAPDALADLLPAWLQSTGVLVKPFGCDDQLDGPSVRIRLWLPGIGVFQLRQRRAGTLIVTRFKPHPRGPHALTAVADSGVHRRALQSAGLR